MAQNSVIVKREEYNLFVTISGYIGETCDLYSVIIDKDVKKIIIDLAKVNYINSIGVKNWILWTRKIPETVSVVFEKCPRLIINQMSMVKGFIPKNSVVNSLYVPYYCESCSDEKSILMEKDKHYFYKEDENSERKPINYPNSNQVKCEKPDCEMAVDIYEKKYFYFLEDS